MINIFFYVFIVFMVIFLLRLLYLRFKMYQIQVQGQRFVLLEVFSQMMIKTLNFREAQASMIPYFIRVAEASGNSQQRPTNDVQRVDSTNTHHQQVIFQT